MSEHTAERGTPTARPYAPLPDALLCDSSLSAQAKIMWTAYAVYADDYGFTSISQGALATRLGVARRTVVRRTQELVDAGWLTVEKRFGADGSRLANNVRLVFPCRRQP